MIFKYKGKEIEVSETFLMTCGQHAAERGMTLEDYIAEAFSKLEEDGKKDSKSQTNLLDQDKKTLAGSGRPNIEDD